MNIFNFFGVNKYYKMTNEELCDEAVKYGIEGYGTYPNGLIVRERIIDQLLKKDTANNSRVATFISISALIVSFIALIKSFI